MTDQLYNCEVTILIPTRDISNMTAYVIESFLRFAGAEPSATIPLTFHCQLPGTTVSKLKHPPSTQDLLDEIRQRTGLSIYKVLSVEILEETGE